MQNTVSKLTQTINKTKILLQNLKKDDQLTLSKALEHQDISIMSVSGATSSNNFKSQIIVKKEPHIIIAENHTYDESVNSKHETNQNKTETNHRSESSAPNELELNIDQKDVAILNDAQIFLVPSAVPRTNDQSNFMKNESTLISDLELNIDEKNILINSTSNNTSQSVGLSIRLENTLANQSSFRDNYSTLNPLERNIDTKSVTLMDSINQTNLANETSSSLNKFELNIDSKSATLLNLSKSINSSHLQGNNESTQNISSSINAHNLNIDSKLGNMTGLQHTINQSNNSIDSETINPHEPNIDTKSETLLNLSQQLNRSGNVSSNQSSSQINNSSLNSHERNIDSKSITLINSSIQPNQASSKSNLFDFSDVNKLMSLVKSLPIDMSVLKSIALPQNEAAKRELNSVETNASDSKRFKGEKNNLLTESKRSNRPQVDNKNFDNKNPTAQNRSVKSGDISRESLRYNCSFVNINGKKCTFAPPYIRHYKKHLKNQNHGEQENLSQTGLLVNPQNLESSYCTSIMLESNTYHKDLNLTNNKQTLSSKFPMKNSVNQYQNNQPKSNDRTPNSTATYSQNMGVYN